MSLLFCSASSMARFRLSETAEGLACASCACADAQTTVEKNNAKNTTARQGLDFAVGRDSLFMLASSLGLWLQKRRLAAALQKLFVAQGLNGLQARGLVRRQIPKKEAGRTGDAKRQQDAHGRYRHAKISREPRLNHHRNCHADENPQDRAAAADQKRLEQELIQNLTPRCSNGLANSDFPSALLHRDEHDVHDSNTADDQRDKREDEQNDRQSQGNLFRHTQDGGERLHIVFRSRRMAAL